MEGLEEQSRDSEVTEISNCRDLLPPARVEKKKESDVTRPISHSSRSVLRLTMFVVVVLLK